MVTLNTKNNQKLNKLLNNKFKRSVIWNEYKSKIQTITTRAADGRNNDTKRILLGCSFQGVNRLFVMGFNTDTVERNGDNPVSHRRYFLARIKINDYNVLINGRNFYDITNY